MEGVRHIPRQEELMKRGLPLMAKESCQREYEKVLLEELVSNGFSEMAGRLLKDYRQFLGR